MKSVKSQQEEDKEMVSKREGLSSNNKDGKNKKKANAKWSKHSVTEQSRRCKINESGVVDHWEDERPSGAHLNFSDVELEPKEGFEERALAEFDHLRYGEVLAECKGGRLEAVEDVESN
ncbi:hypothetical protein RHSIM_Rhsim13G0139100 [Rhododendron simsii]|uniref:Uncharacterized protein n=1 Tax=Rhododendron simsii TaxID=118357 RepID=A0A834G165_RHOSS|nr:hypothetical protein RHSIM_Rhsim13G0139100 [Rhododendron simsii]